MKRVLTSHDVIWSRRDSSSRDQYVTEELEEKSTASVRTHIQQLNPSSHDSGFCKFNFEEGQRNE